MFQPGAFRNDRKDDLDTMSLRDLVPAYVAYPAIRAHLALSILTGAGALVWAVARLTQDRGGPRRTRHPEGATA